MGGFAGNAGNAGNAGGVGLVNSGTGMISVLPDRVDLPFVTVDHPPGKLIAKNRIAIHQYPERNWSAEWRAWYALSEYTATQWSDIVVDPWKDDKHDVDKEIDNLVAAARDERADALGEIVAQNEEFASYFMALLTMTPTTHPGTYRIINLASIVGMFTVLHFKNGIEGRYKPRPRPSQVCPALSPPVPVPGHPSYPSGHSTEAHLVTLCLEDVLKKHKKYASVTADLQALADRIARNREIAGLHYPSDSCAGKKLAASILEYLAPTNEYGAALTVARSEW